MRKPGNKKKSGVLAAAVLGAAGALSAAVAADALPPYTTIAKGFVKTGAAYGSLPRATKKVKTKQLQAELRKANKAQHPFILATAEEFNAVREAVARGDTIVAGYYDTALYYADLLLQDETYMPLPYVLDRDGVVLETSREVLERIISLGLVWQVTGDERYAERAWAELSNVCSFEDWHPAHFLDTAEMTMAVCVGYDWFFDYLSAEQKDILRAAAIEKGIRKGLSLNHFKNWWVWSKVNWNSVCYASMGIGCMTFCDALPGDAARLLRMAFNNMPICFGTFTPDGAYAEGPGYWKYGTSYLVYFIKTASTFLGTEHGLAGYDGVSKLGHFPVHISAPTGVFNYGDNKNCPLYSPVLYWFSREFGDALPAGYQNGFSRDYRACYEAADAESRRGGIHELARESALCALWYTPSDTVRDGARAVHLRSDASQELVIARSGMDKNAFYAAIKAGCNTTNHGDLDIGTFVLDAQGVRWAQELGPGNYSAPGYFVPTVGGGRWQLYEKRAEGQNTLVINPKMAAEDQFPFACAAFSSYEETPGGVTATLAMTDAYLCHGVASAVRTFTVGDGFSTLCIRDEVRCKMASEIYWFMHTTAAIALLDNGKTAKLTLDGKTLWVTSAGDGVFSVLPAVSVANDAIRYTGAIAGLQKLAIHLPDTKSASLCVVLAAAP